MKKQLLTICAGVALSLSAPMAQTVETLPVYLDDSQPIEARVQDALSRMTVEEKARLSYAQGKFSSPGCPRLGIPELWYSDGPHGVRAEINWNLGICRMDQRQLYGFSGIDMPCCYMES